MRIFDKLGVATPVYIFLTLAGVAGVKLLYTDQEFPHAAKNVPIDRDIVVIPEACIENYNKPPQVILKDIFDSVWNACGRQKSLNYEEDGSYVNKHRC